ncbi:MAG: hypothetical protein OXD43_06780 [Bacteroidetes bacterium]|nr:hypothetical protein [Bacteroidota bacterium]
MPDKAHGPELAFWDIMQLYPDETAARQWMVQMRHIVASMIGKRLMYKDLVV